MLVGYNMEKRDLTISTTRISAMLFVILGHFFGLAGIKLFKNA